MHQVEKGIFRLDGILEKPEAPTLVAVHPWHRLGTRSQPTYIIYDAQTGKGLPFSPSPYLANINRLLETHKGNVFLLEEESVLNESFDRLRVFSEKRGRYIVPTHDLTSLPSRANYRTMANLIGERGPHVLLAGGFVVGSESHGNLEACLGLTHANLFSLGLDPEFVEECCFTDDYY